MEGFGAETDLAVWQRISGVLASLDRLVDGEARTTLRHRVAALVRPALERLGIEPAEGDRDRDRQLRGVLLEALGIRGDDHAVQQGARTLLAFIDGAVGGESGPVDPSVLAASITIVAATGGPDDFDAFWRRFTSAGTPQEELRYLYALAAFDDAELLGRLLALALTDEIRTQNAPYVLAQALGVREHGPLVWRFIREHWDEINDRFPSNSIVRMLSGIRTLSRPDVADDVRDFFADHDVPQGHQQLAQHLERLAVNVALRARGSHDLARHLGH